MNCECGKPRDHSGFCEDQETIEEEARCKTCGMKQSNDLHDYPFDPPDGHAFAPAVPATLDILDETVTLREEIDRLTHNIDELRQRRSEDVQRANVEIAALRAENDGYRLASIEGQKAHLTLLMRLDAAEVALKRAEVPNDERR